MNWVLFGIQTFPLYYMALEVGTGPLNGGFLLPHPPNIENRPGNGTSLVVQGLRICLAMQGMRV